MMLIDYKLVWTTQFANSTHLIARIYEGEITTEVELSAGGVPQPVVRYRRAKKLADVFLDYPGPKTAAEIIEILNQRLLSYGAHTPIPEQTNA